MEVVLSFIGAVTGALLTYLGVRFTARQTAKAQKDAATVSAHVSNRQVDLEEWKALVGGLRDEVNRLTSRVEKLEKQRDDDHDHIETLEAEARAHEARYRLLLRFARDVLAWAYRLDPSATPPTPPDVLREEFQSERTH
ncbi:membrane protein [Arthrobacter phage Snek]|uniref:Uncharacterized protein n=1 Tax=Arthrobacter phage Tweety19 TaxID=2768133 RepID=A0A7G9W220_9CAUD|nr:tail needle protein [Arthrobacter phage Tweety19]QNO12683.1 hypothetical protein SEA_TWEETY19_22 [Arthrobacter phage Tweety19]